MTRGSYWTLYCCAEMLDYRELGCSDPLEIRIVALYCTYIDIAVQIADCFLITVETRALLQKMWSCIVIFPPFVVICSRQIVLGETLMALNNPVIFLLLIQCLIMVCREDKRRVLFVSFHFLLSLSIVPFGNVWVLLPAPSERYTGKKKSHL